MENVFSVRCKRTVEDHDACNDEMALGAIRAIKRRDWKVYWSADLMDPRMPLKQSKMAISCYI